tara:strand:- start:27 stop:644 length:618 start_codon:yes stop_codon:yes gene_type:complete
MTKNKGGRPTKARQCTKQNIEASIKSTQSMSQAAIYMGVSLNTFKKYAKLHGLWNPLPSSKGIRKSHNGNFTHDIGMILEGKNPNPYRDQTLLNKAIQEGYIAPCCSNCNQEFHDYNMRKHPPLMLDFLDKNPQNTQIHNLRALCFNCVYSLYYTLKGWYRHRDTAIYQALDEINPKVPETTPEDAPETDNLSYIPFEDFQKTLK